MHKLAASALLVVLLSCIVSQYGANNVDPQCRVVSNLSFCKMVNYNVSALYTPNVQQTESDAITVYERTKNSLKIQTPQCLESYKVSVSLFMLNWCY